jgi:tetratricopeptide (TPR) repeat protein
MINILTSSLALALLAGTPAVILPAPGGQDLERADYKVRLQRCVAGPAELALPNCLAVIQTLDVPDPVIALAYARRGDIYFESRQYAKAVEEYDVALRMAPPRASVSVLLDGSPVAVTRADGQGGFNREAWVHRKGATRAFPAGHPGLANTPFAATGHPILLPGNPRDGSVVMVAQPDAVKSSSSGDSTTHTLHRRGSASSASRVWISIGWPHSSRYCLGIGESIRAPRPAAGTRACRRGVSFTAGRGR